MSLPSRLGSGLPPCPGFPFRGSVTVSRASTSLPSFQQLRNRQGLPSSRRLSPHMPRSKVDPGRPSGTSPSRFLRVGFWAVNTIAICFIRAIGAVSSFRECDLPCGLRGSLGTLHMARSATASSPCATLGTSGWLILTRPGLSPGKRRQASLGALTALRISGGRSRELARGDDRTLQPLDGRRKAPDRERMEIRSADGAALSRSALQLTPSIIKHTCNPPLQESGAKRPRHRCG